MRFTLTDGQREIRDEARSFVRDHVEYAVLGGRIVNKLFVRRDLERIFAFRTGKLALARGPPARHIARR